MLCHYCGAEEGIYIQKGTDNPCCKPNFRACQGFKDKIKEKSKNSLLERYGTINTTKIQEIRRSKEWQDKIQYDKDLKAGKIPPPENQVCEYGCGQLATYYLWFPRLWACSKNYRNCPIASKKAEEEYKKNYMKKYGVEWSTQREDFKELVSKTCMERYGVSHHMSVPELKEKQVKATFDKYGNGCNREKQLQTVRDRYGVENVFQLKDVKEKSTNTMILRYGGHPWKNVLWRIAYHKLHGVSNPAQLQDVKEKRAQTLLNNPEIIKNRKLRAIATYTTKYGTPHHFQNKEWFNSFKRGTLYKLKDYVLPSGKIIKLQGYEPEALSILLSIYEELDILFDNNIPDIWYINPISNKHCRYYPDFYIRTTNTIIEIKSRYTYESDLDKNLAKKKTVLELGYGFNFWIKENDKADFIIY
jgi:hypothetical protein